MKFYIDQLKLLAFHDDRQIHYIAAQSWRLPAHIDQSRLAHRESSVYVTIERFVDYRRRFDLFFALIQNSDFLYDARWSSELVPLLHRYDWRNGDSDDLLHDVLPDLLFDTFFGSIEHVRPLQERLLALNKIDEFDRPAGSKISDIQRNLLKIRDLKPWTIDLGEVTPRKGESSEYRERLRAALQDFKEKDLTVFRRMVTPPELDIQIAPSGLQLRKDLDNIMLDIAPVFNDVVLEQSTYLQGFRIYVAGQEEGRNSTGSIRLKLLPPGAIGQFENDQKILFEAAEKWIENQIAL